MSMYIVDLINSTDSSGTDRKQNQNTYGGTNVEKLVRLMEKILSPEASLTLLNQFSHIHAWEMQGNIYEMCQILVIVKVTHICSIFWRFLSLPRTPVYVKVLHRQCGGHGLEVPVRYRFQGTVIKRLRGRRREVLKSREK